MVGPAMVIPWEVFAYVGAVGNNRTKYEGDRRPISFYGYMYREHLWRPVVTCSPFSEQVRV